MNPLLIVIISSVAVLMIGAVVAVTMRRYNAFLSNEVHGFHYAPDDFVSKTNSYGNKNYLYRVKSGTPDYIDSYIISNEKKIPFLICHSIKDMTQGQALRITCFDRSRKPISIDWINPRIVDGNMLPIRLSNKTRYVNLGIVSDTDFSITSSDIASAHKKYRLIALWMTLFLVVALIPISYLILLVMAGQYLPLFLNVFTYMLLTGLALPVVIGHYLWMIRTSKKLHLKEPHHE